MTLSLILGIVLLFCRFGCLKIPLHHILNEQPFQILFFFLSSFALFVVSHGFQYFFAFDLSFFALPLLLQLSLLQLSLDIFYETPEFLIFLLNRLFISFVVFG